LTPSWRPAEPWAITSGFLDATAEAMERHPEVAEARFWLFGQDAYDVFAAALRERS
jgi:hypothetical protein